MKILVGIASTTHIDRQGDKIIKSALEDVADQINTKYIRLLVNHDSSQEIGVQLAGKVLPMCVGAGVRIIE